MHDHATLDRALKCIDIRLREAAAASGRAREPRSAPLVTISRQSGTGGILLGERLAAALDREFPDPDAPWTVFHKNLVERVLEEHHLPRRLAEYMPEDRVSAVADAVEELLGLHPAAGQLVRQTTETILHLASLGRVILVGRAANVVTARHPLAVHLRLIGSPERRARRAAEARHVPLKAAATLIEEEDQARRRYLKSYFHRDIDDPLLYHAVLNMDWLGVDDAVAMVLPLVCRCVERTPFAPATPGPGGS